jgi:hypothetical protein
MNFVENRSTVIELLEQNVCSISFTKVKDGGTRKMKCTLKPSLLPARTEEVKRQFNDETIRVFDLDLNEWRAFRVDSLLHIMTLDGQETGKIDVIYEKDLTTADK